MSQDHIVDEVRATRDEIAREHGYDLKAIFDMLRRTAEESGREHVSPTPPVVARKAPDATESARR
jgi:hypothetical protein